MIPKFCKGNNPFNVQVGQTWKAKDRRRKGKFKILTFYHVVDFIWVALVLYSNGKTTYKRMINLKRFDRYVKCK